MSANERENAMRKFIVTFFLLTLMLSTLSMTAYAIDCTKDTPVDKFGDWFGNLGKPEQRRKQNIAMRKASRLAECEEKKAQEVTKSV